MKYSTITLIVLLFALVAPGCFRDATVTGLPVADEPALEDWRNHFLGGVVRGIKTDDVELDEICPEGVARIETKQNGWNGLVSVLTLGIYTPQKLNVFCAAVPKDAAVQPAALTGEASPAVESPAEEESEDETAGEGAS